MNRNIVIFCVIIKLAVGDWVDPHEMNTNVKQKYIKPTLEKSFSVPSDNSCTKDSQVYQLYLKRLISLISNAAHIHNSDNGIYDGHIRFLIDSQDWQYLTSFSKNDITLDSLRKLDTIFSETFKKSLTEEYIDQFEWYQMKLYSLIVNVNNLWIMGSLFIIHIIYQLLKNGFSIGYIIKYLVFVIFVWDFAIRFQTLLVQVEKHNSQVIYSKQCDTSKMSWKEYGKFLISSTDCEMKSVTPLDVFLVQIKQIIIIPLKALGTGMGGFGRELFTTLPWGVNLVLWPVMLLFVVLLVICIMLCVTGYNIDFNMLHLFKLTLKSGKSSETRNYLTGHNTDRLAPALTQRSMIQEVSTSDETKSNKQKIQNKKKHLKNKSTESVESENKLTSPTNASEKIVDDGKIGDDDHTIETIKDSTNTKNESHNL